MPLDEIKDRLGEISDLQFSDHPHDVWEAISKLWTDIDNSQYNF